jgi:DamX protein
MPVIAVRDEASIKREPWLQQQKSTAYTLQLIGVGDEQAAKAFIQRYPLPGPTAYFMTQREGRPWYSVVHGLYRDRAAAIKGKGSLPEPLRDGSAWPRSLDSIQAAIKK